jgi:GxxExxY protein
MNTNTTKDMEKNIEIRKKLNDLTKFVIGAAIEVHRALGPGLLESAYEICFYRELNLREIRFQRQVPIALEYKGVKLDCGYHSDVIVEETLLLELKAVDALLPIHEAQLLSYLKLTELNVGLLINFNVELLRDGIRRRVLNSGPPLFSSVRSATSVVNFDE